jgi:hypothetical protein
MENGMNNIITIAGENSKRKKGAGTNAVLTLMKELGDFQDKVESCIDAQDMSDNKKKLEIFYDKLDEMAEVLLGMASDGIKSKRKMEGLEEEILEDDLEEDLEEKTLEEDLEDEVLEDDRPPVSSMGRIQMVNAPVIPKLPR